MKNYDLVPYEGNNQLVPQYFQTPMLPDFNGIVQAQPLVQLSDRSVEILTRAKMAELRVQETTSRLNLISSVSHDHAALGAQFLMSRQEGENFIKIDSSGFSKDRAWIFGNGERFSYTTTISIQRRKGELR